MKVIQINVKNFSWIPVLLLLTVQIIITAQLIIVIKERKEEKNVYLKDAEF